MKKEKKFTVVELVWYGLGGAIFLWGLTFVVLGLIAMYAPIANSDNALRAGSDAYAKVFGMGFFPWGLINMGIGLVILVPTLLYYSKKVDREFEKEQRRAAMRAYSRKKQDNPETVIEAPVSEN